MDAESGPARGGPRHRRGELYLARVCLCDRVADGGIRDGASHHDGGVQTSGASAALCRAVKPDAGQAWDCAASLEGFLDAVHEGSRLRLRLRLSQHNELMLAIRLRNSHP